MKTPLHSRLTLIAICALLTVVVAHGQDARINLNGSINGKPVRFIFDTGAEATTLSRESAERLGLRITPRPKDSRAPSPGAVPVDLSEECTFAVGNGSVKRTFPVVDVPSYLMRGESFDGFFSWTELNTGDNVFLIDTSKRMAGPVPLPANIGTWTKWNIVPDAIMLMFERTDGKETTRIGIDTGDDDGVLQDAVRWKKWSGEHVNQPTTVDAGWYPADGLVIREMLRTPKMEIGGLALEDVPVIEESASVMTLYKECDAVLGLFALSRMKLIIDRKNGLAYTAPIANPVRTFDYNRLGAVFTPNNPEKDDDLIAHVMNGSPAEEAGIRDGDILLKVGDTDMTKWRSDPTIEPHKIWSQTPGTHLQLLLKRGGDTREVMVTLKEPNEGGWHAPDPTVSSRS